MLLTVLKMLTRTRKRVIRSAIRPGITSGGTTKLIQDTTTNRPADQINRGHDAKNMVLGMKKHWEKNNIMMYYAEIIMILTWWQVVRDQVVRYVTPQNHLKSSNTDDVIIIRWYSRTLENISWHLTTFDEHVTVFAWNFPAPHSQESHRQNSKGSPWNKFSKKHLNLNVYYSVWVRPSWLSVCHTWDSWDIHNDSDWDLDPSTNVWIIAPCCFA